MSYLLASSTDYVLYQGIRNGVFGTCGILVGGPCIDVLSGAITGIMSAHIRVFKKSCV
jgi:hypothetical protein